MHVAGLQCRMWGLSQLSQLVRSGCLKWPHLSQTYETWMRDLNVTIIITQKSCMNISSFTCLYIHYRHVRMWHPNACMTIHDSVPGGGGGGGVTPNFGRYVPRQSEKNGKGSGTSSRSSVKMGSPERAWAVLSLKMGGGAPDYELEPFWFVKIRGAGTAANPLRCRTLENANLRNGR